tara:strand:- start:241 stop:618 length:378 start_codon:yes stop_codon:yes gene_type:complete
MRQHSIENFFFLDQSIPFLVRTALRGEKRCAVRVSEYESIENAMLFSGLVGWIWVDTFSKLPLNNKGYLKLKECGFKLCLVSPELQSHDSYKVNSIKETISKEQIEFDAVCTKSPETWKDFKISK